MKSNNTFQYVIIGVFIFFTIVGAIMFSTYRSSKNAESNIMISVWGSLPPEQFTSFTNQYFGDKDLKYTINYFYKDRSTLDQQLVEALASGGGPDAVILPQDLIVRYQNKVYPIPYTALPELNFKQTYIQQGEMFLSSKGVLALPLTIDPLIMYWNRDIFNNNSITKPPATWSDFNVLSPKFTKKDQAQNITKSFVALGEYRNISNAKAILSTLFLQTGNQIVGYNQSDESFESTLDSDDNNANSLALQFYTNFSNPNKPEYSWNRSLPSSIDSFTDGDLAIYFGFASEFSYIKSKNPNLNFDVAIVPQIKGGNSNITFGNVWGLAILKNSKDPAGTYKVISALVSPEAVSFWNSQFKTPSARRDVLGALETNAAKAILNKSAIISRGWYDPKSAETNNIFQEMVESYTTGRETIGGALNTASDRLDNLLKR